MQSMLGAYILVVVIWTNKLPCCIQIRVWSPSNLQQVSLVASTIRSCSIMVSSTSSYRLINYDLSRPLLWHWARNANGAEDTLESLSMLRCHSLILTAPATLSASLSLVVSATVERHCSWRKMRSLNFVLVAVAILHMMLCHMHRLKRAFIYKLSMTCCTMEQISIWYAYNYFSSPLIICALNSANRHNKLSKIVSLIKSLLLRLYLICYEGKQLHR